MGTTFKERQEEFKAGELHVRKVQAWECPACGMEWLSPEAAETCCPVDRELVLTRYQCPVCDDFWSTPSEAVHCCTGDRVRDEEVEVMDADE